VIKMRWGDGPRARLRGGAAGRPSSRWAKIPSARTSACRPPRYPATAHGRRVVAARRLPPRGRTTAELDEYDASRSGPPGPRGDRSLAPARTWSSTSWRDILDGKVYVHAHCYRRTRPDAHPPRRRVRLQGAHVPARARGLQGRERDRQSTARAASTFADFWGLQDGGLRPPSYNAASWPRTGERLPQLRTTTRERAASTGKRPRRRKYGGVRRRRP